MIGKYFEKVIAFLDGRNGFHQHQYVVLNEINEETGILFTDTRQDKKSKWERKVFYKDMEYTKISAAIDAYEKDKGITIKI